MNQSESQSRDTSATTAVIRFRLERSASSVVSNLRSSARTKANPQHFARYATMSKSKIRLDKRSRLWYNARMDETLDPIYDHYDRMSDDDLIREMETAVSVLQMSNQEELSAALHAFINRYRDVCRDYRDTLTEIRSKTRNV